MRLFGVAVLAAGCGLSQPAPSLRAVTPASVCGSAPRMLTLDGDGFVALPTGVLGAQAVALPSITLDGPMKVVLADDPAAATGPVQYVSSHQLVLSLMPPAPGSYAITVGNPDGQSSALPTALTTVAGPTITMISPNRICAGAGGAVMLTGTGFQPGATVKIVDPMSGMSLDGTLTVMSATQATASFPAVSFAQNQDVDLILTNPDACAGSATIRVKPGNGGC